MAANRIGMDQGKTIPDPGSLAGGGAQNGQGAVNTTPELPEGDARVRVVGASGQTYFDSEEGPPPWQMPEPTTVSQVRDDFPSGRHMIDGFRMMGAAARVSGGKHQKEMAQVYETAALCIENEAKRADRAEAILAQDIPRRSPPAHATPEEASKTGAPPCPGMPSNKASQ
jgi:hypothetical protein